MRGVRAAVVALAVLVPALAVLGAARTPAPPTHRLEIGRAVYARACATCHGQAGNGDGPAAAAFATKPTALTDGRLMNGLPDEFLSNIIVNGGPAEGLAPTMPPFRGLLTDPEIDAVIAHVRALAQPPFDPAQARPVVAVPGAPAQPIFFSHLIHAGKYAIPCQHCHAGARRGTYAGLPSVERCLGCHKIIGAQDNPEIQKIQEYFRRGEPIPWVRVFGVPEFTYFPHKPHVQAGVACQTCHGPIERMRIVGARTGPRLINDLQHLVGLRPPPPPFSMGWCIDCHRDQNARGRQAPLDCITCHH
jgi:mono/diheme cytochrome c family protein